MLPCGDDSGALGCDNGGGECGSSCASGGGDNSSVGGGNVGMVLEVEEV